MRYSIDSNDLVPSRNQAVREHGGRRPSSNPSEATGGPIVNASVSYLASAEYPLDEVVGADRLRGRTQTELADAMTWLAWYAPGVYNAVMDYMDRIDDERVVPV